MAEERTTPTVSWGGAGNAPHLAPNKFGPTKKSLKEKIQENDISTHIIRLRRSRGGENGKLSKDHDHSTVLQQRQEGGTDGD